jgi:FixJ family two-component response regulator
MGGSERGMPGRRSTAQSSRGIVTASGPSVGHALVSVVDDDESVRESLPDLLRQCGFATEAFASAEEFLGSDALSETSCLLLDVAMPGMSGTEVQQELIRLRQTIPIVFITASGDRTLRPRLLARGAVECLFKPFSEAALLEAVRAALRRPRVGPEGAT